MKSMQIHDKIFLKGFPAIGAVCWTLTKALMKDNPDSGSEDSFVLVP